MTSDWDFSLDLIQKKLALSQAQSIADDDPSAFLPDNPSQAAVLVPLLRAPVGENGTTGWHLLFTRRSDRLVAHRGQVSFPGGRFENGDASSQVTALREAQEEIGLDPTQVQILGSLNRVWTITNYSITPIVGVIPWPFPVRLEEIEVSRVFTIPLAWLADPAHQEIRQRTIPEPFSTRLQVNSLPVIYFHPYLGEVLWGVSAEITKNLLNILS
jgi:8-oxo-dGTP pyrophosphatase MutT (NUDIX family)